jgi:MSHA pilin protein MshD
MSNRSESGFTLIEMIIAIVIIGIGLAGVMTAFTTTVKSSADPLLHKQMLAVAEEMMEEILLKPYAVTGTAPTNLVVSCGAAGASRLAFDDVLDYHNYRTTGICDIEGNSVAGLATYNLEVSVTTAAWQTIPNTRQVVVTVRRSSEDLVLRGWRTDYAG